MNRKSSPPLWINHAKVWTMQFGIPRFVDAAVEIRDGLIFSLCHPEQLPDRLAMSHNGVEVYDAQGAYVTPSFVNGHSHSYTGILPRTVEGYPLDLYMLEAIAYGTDRSEQFIHDCTLLHADELVRWGYRQTVDHFSQRPALSEEGIQAAASAYRQLGLKAVIAPMYADKPYLASLPFPLKGNIPETKGGLAVPEFTSLMRKLKLAYESDPFIGLALGVDGLQRCSQELLQAAGRLKSELGLGWQTHMLESHTQWTYGQLRHVPLVELADRYGLLDERTTLVHAVWMTEEDIRLIGARGASIVHCPCSNLHLGSGICPVHKFERQRVPWFLGTDGFNCGTLSPYEVMRTAARLSRLLGDVEADWITARQVFLRMIAPTPLDPSFGRENGIRIGAPADLLIFPYSDLDEHAFFREAVYYESGERVKVMLGGRWIDRRAEEPVEETRRRIQQWRPDYTEALADARRWFPEVKEQIRQSRLYVEQNWPYGRDSQD